MVGMDGIVNNIMKTKFKLGDPILVSPYLTHRDGWEKGKVVDIEDNVFNGTVISAETEDGDVFFQREDPDYFRKVE